MKEIDNLTNTFHELIGSYELGLMFNDDDTMITWNAKCEWFIKQMVDIKVGVGFEYFKIQSEYNPLQEETEKGEGLDIE